MPRQSMCLRWHFRLFAIAILTSSFSAVFAQGARIGISTSYNVPIGELKWTYSPGMGVKLHASSIKSKKSKISKITAISIGYTLLPPLADTLYYLVDHGGSASVGGGAGLGKAAYSPFKLFQLEGSYGWGLPLGKKLTLEPSVSLGAVYGRRSATFTDVFGGSDGFNELMTWASLTPLLAVHYKLGERWSVSGFLAYTIILQMGNTKPNTLTYNENAGMFYHYYSPGVLLNYSF